MMINKYRKMVDGNCFLEDEYLLADLTLHKLMQVKLVEYDLLLASEIFLSTSHMQNLAIYVRIHIRTQYHFSLQSFSLIKKFQIFYGNKY